MEFLKSLYKKYEHLSSPVFFIFGFLLDVFTLGRVDDLSNIIILSLYFAVSLFIFVIEFDVIESHSENRSTITNAECNPLLSVIVKYKDEIFHFSQGALLSAFTLFFFKSASLSVSFLFMIFITTVLLMNELPIFQKLGPSIKSILFSLNLFSLYLVYVPLAIGKLGGWVFSLTCLLYIVFSVFFTFFILRKTKNPTMIKKIWIPPATIIFLMFITLRWLNLIPPVPLSLETAGIFHNIEKKYPSYHLFYQKEWWRFWNTSSEYFRYKRPQKIYFFTRIFAPGGFEDDVIVHWQKYVKGEWSTTDKIPLKITGGRKKGYRGLAFKSNYSDGLWRIRVETRSGSEIGRLNFQIERATPDYNLPNQERIDSN